MLLRSVHSPLLLLLFALTAAVANTAFAAPPLRLVPNPHRISVASGSIKLNSRIHITASDRALFPLVSVLSHEIALITGIRMESAPSKADHRILLRIDPGMKAEAYKLNVGPNGIEITGGSYAGVAFGTATLLQSLACEGSVWVVQHMSIEDEPAYAYRGALLDLARKYHTPAGIEQVIELCRLYKIRFLHLHISDDQLFMFPSTAYPQLGQSNSEFARFEPASQSHTPPYTLAELNHLEEFARDRAVYLVPEIDLPGHSGRMIADGGSLFGIPGNGSTVNIASPGTVRALTILLNEVMDVFSSTPYVHLGADEVGLGGLEATQEYKKATARDGIKSVHDLYCKFVSDMHDVVAKRGKRCIVWEEACDSSGPYPLPKDTLVMVWTQNRNPNEITQAGYTVINAGWTPLYIVRDNKRSPQFLYNWDPTEFGGEGSTQFTKLAPDQNLAGAQLCSWENSECLEIQSMRTRLAVLSEKLWNVSSSDSYSQFEQRFIHTDLLLSQLVEPVVVDAKANFSPNENSFTTPLEIALSPRNIAENSGLTLKYTLQNDLPGATWKAYTGPIKPMGSVYLRAGLFDSTGKQHGYLTGRWFKDAVPVKPNLATGKPVSVGPSPDRDDAWAAKVAVDGQSSDPMKHWASVGEAPQWFQVDLGKRKTINFINLITYWDGSRYYQWNAQISEDGKTWTTVVNRSGNTTMATSAGYAAKFPPVSAHYVRINMLKNSANPFVHIVELIVENRN